MNIDFQYFWKLFTSMATSLAILVAFWEGLKKLKGNTAEARAELKRKEKRQEALDELADNITVFTDYKRSSEEQELIKVGMLAILRFRANRLCVVIKEQGFMTIDEKIDLEDLYSAYSSLGGNSRTHELFEYTIKEYPIRG